MYSTQKSCPWLREFSTEFQADDDMSKADAALIVYRDLLQDRCNDYGPPPMIVPKDALSLSIEKPFQKVRYRTCSIKAARQLNLNPATQSL